jgi:hypothetical protein
MKQLTLRQRWDENRRRRSLGLPEIDANGKEILPKILPRPRMSNLAYAKMVRDCIKAKRD